MEGVVQVPGMPSYHPEDMAWECIEIHQEEVGMLAEELAVQVVHIHILAEELVMQVDHIHSLVEELVAARHYSKS